MPNGFYKAKTDTSQNQYERGSRINRSSV